MTPAQRAHFQSQLEALIFSGDPDLIRQGCELVVSLRDAALLSRLGAGCAITPDGRLLFGNPLFGRVLPRYRSLVALQFALSLAGLHSKPVPCLRLPFDRLGDAGAELIASSSALRSLERLDLRGNQIRNPGATALARSTSLPRLRSLDLSDNHIEKDGALALATAASFTAYLQAPVAPVQASRVQFSRVSGVGYACTT